MTFDINELFNNFAAMGKTNDNNNQQPVDLSRYTDALAETYEPAKSPAETTHWFTTEEVAAAIRQVNPSLKVDVTQVFDALHAAGYDFCNPPGSQGLHFKWMFREKDR